MGFASIIPQQSIALFVKNIWVFSNDDRTSQTSLPFFADGYPGLMFQQTDNGLTVSPHNKVMPEIFLYGQTIKPIELKINGRYLIIIFQLYPFVLKSFFDVIPQTINDSCYYLENAMGADVDTLTKKLLHAETIEEKVNILSALLHLYFDNKKQKLDFKIRQAIEAIILSKGQESIQLIAEKLHINLRTLERRFTNETGLSPKQFSRIIQFQSSLEQLTVKDFNKLTDIVYRNGFSDQSHFIRVFKAFTGKTPKNFHR